MEASTEAKPAGKRERPDFKALATQRNEVVAKKTSGVGERIKGFFGRVREGGKVAKDFVLTIDARAAYRAGQAKDIAVGAYEATRDAAVSGARAVRSEVVQDAKAVYGAGVRGKDYAAGKGKEGVEWTKARGSEAVQLGRDGVEAVHDGMERARDYSLARFSEAGAAIASRRQEYLDSKETRAWNAEQTKVNGAQDMIRALQARIATSQEAQTRIERGFQDRLKERDVSYPNQEVATAAA